jgi:hypothetical protein
MAPPVLLVFHLVTIPLYSLDQILPMIFKAPDFGGFCPEKDYEQIPFPVRVQRTVKSICVYNDHENFF